MKKPKIKKRGGAWIVYRNKKQMFKCFSESGARTCYGALWIEYEKEKSAFPSAFFREYTRAGDHAAPLD